MIGLPGGSNSKESACNVGDPGSIPGLGRAPREENGKPFLYSCLKNPMDGGASSVPEKSRGQRSLVGYSPLGHKESDTTEELTHTHNQSPEFFAELKLYTHETALHFPLPIATGDHYFIFCF